MPRINVILVGHEWPLKKVQGRDIKGAFRTTQERAGERLINFQNFTIKASPKRRVCCCTTPVSFL